MDAHGRYPCLRKCGRTFGHAPAAIAHTKTCKYNGPNLPKELRPDAAPKEEKPLRRFASRESCQQGRGSRVVDAYVINFNN